MGGIIIRKQNGQLMPLNSRTALSGIKTASQNIELAGADIVNITVDSATSLVFDIGDEISVFGRTYSLNRMPSVQKMGVNKFVYQLEFEGSQYQLSRASYELSIRTTDNSLQDVQADSLIGNLALFAKVLISNANRVMPDRWILGVVPTTIEDKFLTFSETDNCLTVLHTLCREFDVEYNIVEKEQGVYTINFENVGKVFPFTFEFGKSRGLYQLIRQNVASSNIVNRLKVQGSTKNITTKYRSNRLCLAGKTKSESYIEDAESITKFGLWEATKYFEDEYPNRVGVVGVVKDGSVLEFSDNEMFDLKAKDKDGNSLYLLSGITAKIQFNTGNLAGYDFDLKDYDHKTKTFFLKPKQDDRGDIFPSESSAAFQFKAGDKYFLKDIAYPELYEQKAESSLEETAKKYLSQNSQPKVQYGLSISQPFLKGLVGNETIGNVVLPGDYIPIKDEEVGVNKSVRVKSIRRNILNPYDYNITVSDVVEVSIINRVISDLIEVDKVVKANELKDPTRYQNSWRTSQEVLGMVFDAEGDYYTDKIKPESIDTMALSVGAKSMQFVLQNTVIEANYNSNKNLVKVTGGTLIHYAISDEGVKDWTLSDSEVVLATNDAYYIYAKCQKQGTSGSIIFTNEQIKVDEDAMYYHFLIGVANSVDAKLNVRALSLMYGFTTVNGKYITTGLIQSVDGTTILNLDTASLKLGELLRYEDGKLHIDGALFANNLWAESANVGNFVMEKGVMTSVEKTPSGKPNLELNGGLGLISALRGNIGRFQIYDKNLVGIADDGREIIRFTGEEIPTVNNLYGDYDVIRDSELVIEPYDWYYDSFTEEITRPYISKNITRFSIDHPSEVRINDIIIMAEIKTPNVKWSDFNVVDKYVYVKIKKVSDGTIIFDGKPDKLDNVDVYLEDTGTYEIEMIAYAYFSSSKNSFGCLFQMTYEYRAVQAKSGQSAKTCIGSDGMYSTFSNGEYFHYKANNGFEIKAGNFGIKIAKDGVKKWNNQKWVDVNW